ncbi:hypothetical protein FRC12_010991 [Ceratobasidium sp. 428]|nr:hypothetical protein FRC12_010991 [Ceratobasidium sp. 428]
MSNKRKASRKPPGEPKAKRRTKSKKAKVKDCPTHLPSPTLNVDHLEWVDEYQNAYNLRLGNKGDPNGAFAWVRSHITSKFLDEWFPELDQDDREEFRPYVDATINQRLNNRSNCTNVADPTVEWDPNSDSMPGAALYIWHHENPGVFDDVWLPMCREDPSLIKNPGARRSLVTEMWKKLPEAEKLPYQTRWQEMKRVADNRVVEGEEKIPFLNDVTRKVSSMARRAEQRGKVFMEARIAIEVNGILHIRQVGSRLGEKYLASDGGATALSTLEEWLKAQIESMSAKPQPDVAISPNREEHMRPSFPDLEEHQPLLQLLRSMVRTAISAIWQLHGGTGHVPYKDISEAIAKGDYSWIPKESLRKGAPWKESGYLTKDECQVWLKHLANWDFGSSATEFRFAKVYVDSGNPKPAHPEAASIRESTRSGQSAWIAVYEKPIAHPQNVHPIYYPRASWEYLYFLLDQPPGLSHWRGLPSRSESEAFKPISDEEYETLLLLFDGADGEFRDLVADILLSVNKMEAKMPVWVS